MIGNRKLNRVLIGLAVLFTVAVVVVIAAVAHWSWLFRERVVILHVEGTAALTDEQAVTLTRDALVRVGEDAAQFAPAAFKGEEAYARNTITPYSGYVLWNSRDNSGHGFAVHLEQSGTNVRCGVVRAK